MAKDFLDAMLANQFPDKFEYQVQWMFDDEPRPCPAEKAFTSVDIAMGFFMAELLPRIKTLSFVSVTRRLK